KQIASTIIENGSFVVYSESQMIPTKECQFTQFLPSSISAFPTHLSPFFPIVRIMDSCSSYLLYSLPAEYRRKLHSPRGAIVKLAAGPWQAGQMLAHSCRLISALKRSLHISSPEGNHPAAVIA